MWTYFDQKCCILAKRRALFNQSATKEEQYYAHAGVSNLNDINKLDNHLSTFYQTGRFSAGIFI
jgi:hypothetical protein